MKYFVTYQLPHEGLDAWMKLPEEERKAPEEDMQKRWNEWMETHKSAILETAGVGKPQHLTANGVEEGRNDMMMYSFVEAESIEAATEMFKDHPHLSILPGAWIEVMPTNAVIL